MLKNNYKKSIVLLLLILFLISVGCVSASDENTTIASSDNAEIISQDEMVLADNSYTQSADDLVDKSSSNNNTILFDDKSSNYQVNEVIINPSFELNKTSVIGWNSSQTSVITSINFAKNGTYFISLNNNESYISQEINFDTIDEMSFWYMSSTQNSTIGIYLDDTFLMDYTIKKTGYSKNRWEEIKLDVSNVNGYHRFKIIQITNNIAYLDNFNVVYNNKVLAKFNWSSFFVDGDEITIDFADHSHGLISEYYWDFGDGITSKLQNPTHTFKLGYYNITLTVGNEHSSDRYVYKLPISVPTIERTGIGYSSIQEAIDNAVDGDVIIITPNVFFDTYLENIVIDKSLDLMFNGCRLLSKYDDSLISIKNGAHVVINNISLDSSNGLSTGDDSVLIFEDSSISNADITLSEGNFIIENSAFSNSFLTIIDANVTISYCNISSGGVIVNGGKSNIHNNIFSYCDVAVSQNNGILELTSNDIVENIVGVNVTGGISKINFNEICSNSHFGLIYSIDAIDYSNNWWGSNNPSFNSSINIPDDCYDIYKLGTDFTLPSYLILNITKHDLDYHYWIRGVTYYNLTIDLCHNNLGEDISDLGAIPDKNYKLLFNNVPFDVYIENGFKEYLFTWSYLTSDVGEMNILFSNQLLTLPLDVRPATLNLVHVVEGYYNYYYWAVNETLKVDITPSSIFNDSMEVVMQCNDSEAIIFYTLDGSDAGSSPTRKVYNGPFTVNDTTVVHYCALDSLGNFYMIEESILQINKPSLIRDHCFILFYIINNGVAENSIYYTLDGTDPVDSDSKITYTHPFFIDEISNLRAVWPYYFWTGTEYILKTYAFRIYTYNYDFSATYLKEVNTSSNNAIWSKYQGDINNSGVTNYSGPLNNISKWSLDNIVSGGSAVVDKDGHVYIGGDDGYLYCLNSQGLIIWRFGTTSKIICTPTIGSDGNIYFVNWLNATLYCLSPNGQLVWKYVLGDYNTGSSPVFGYDDILYVISGDDTYSTLFAFKNQKLLWSSKFPALIAHTPIVGDDGAVYLLSKSNYLFGVNVDGSLKFGVTLVLTDEEAAHAKSSNPANFIYGSGEYASLSRDDKCMYIVNHDTVYAYYFNGTQAWHKRLFGASGTPTIFNDVLYISATSGLYALNATNSNQLWFKSLKTTSLSLSSPLVSSNSSIIYLSGNSTVYAISLNGDLLWNYSIPSKYGGAFSVSSPTLTDDGTLIVTTIQGIYAFNDIAAEFIYSHVNGTERTIQFTDLSTKGNNSYFWSFGDGYYSTEQNPQHMYAQAGKYRVELVVEHDGINLARNTTIEVVSYDITPPAPVTVYIGDVKTSGGVFAQTQTVNLVSSDDSGIYAIYYTVDGSNPISSSTRRLYSEPIDIEVYTVLSAVAVDSSGNYGSVSSLTFNITDAVNVNDRVNSTLIQKIQELLDNAEQGSKFVFDYDELYGANFTINKPLNIITNVNTKLIGNGNQPVFTINAENTTVNGFTIINDGAEGILVKDTENARIVNSIVCSQNANAIDIINSKGTDVKDTLVNGSDNGILVQSSSNTLIGGVDIENSTRNGIYLKDSKGTVIQNCLLENNGVDPYYSEANNILLDNNENTKIINNTINYGYFGLYFKNTNKNILVDNNTIYEGSGDAIYLSGNYINLNITHNSIEGCFMGINFNGYSESVEVLNNLIWKIHTHDGSPESGREYDMFYNFKHRTDLYGQYDNAIQVFELASNFHNQVHIENNVCILVEHRAWEARKTSTYTQAGCDNYGYNLMDGSDSYHWLNSGATHYAEGKVNLVLDRIGDSSYRLRLQNMKTGEFLSEIPAFDVTFTAGRYKQTVKFVDSQAVATFDVASSITTITATISREITKSISWNTPIADGFSSSNRDNDPGYEAGEAINNPNPKAPSIADMINRFTGHNGNGGSGSGSGTGSGNGNGNGNFGSRGSGGSDVNGFEGDILGDATTQILSDTGSSPSVGVESAAEGDDASTEGGSESSSTDSVKSYEVKKVIDINNTDKLVVPLIVLAFIFFIIGYIRRDDDDDELKKL